MKILLDTCVVLDSILRRNNYKEVRIIFEWCIENGNGYLTAKSCCDIYYILHKHTHSHAQTVQLLTDLLSILKILDTNGKSIIDAMQSNMSDYEDAVMVETAVNNEIDMIITDNIKDFAKQNKIVVIRPEEWTEPK